MRFPRFAKKNKPSPDKRAAHPTTRNAARARWRDARDGAASVAS